MVIDVIKSQVLWKITIILTISSGGTFANWYVATKISYDAHLPLSDEDKPMAISHAIPTLVTFHPPVLFSTYHPFNLPMFLFSTYASTCMAITLIRFQHPPPHPNQKKNTKEIKKSSRIKSVTYQREMKLNTFVLSSWENNITNFLIQIKNINQINNPVFVPLLVVYIFKIQMYIW